MDAPFYGQETGNVKRGKGNWTFNKTYSKPTLGFVEGFCKRRTRLLLGASKSGAFWSGYPPDWTPPPLRVAALQQVSLSEANASFREISPGADREVKSHLLQGIHSLCRQSPGSRQVSFVGLPIPQFESVGGQLITGRPATAVKASVVIEEYLL
jgi:hypothetical protein